MSKGYWYFWNLITEGKKNNKRYKAYEVYKAMIDDKVNEFEILIKKYEVGSTDYEKCRKVLNELYKTQFFLEHCVW